MSALVVWVVAYFLPGASVASFWVALEVAFVLELVNRLIRI